MTTLWSLVLGSLFSCQNVYDFDRDGFVEPEDCNDNDEDSYPGAEEIPYDKIDQDCSGADLVDVDGDGWTAWEAGGQDCNDLRADVYPNAEEIPYDNVDSNCDGWNDNDFDRDGFEARGQGGNDCDDFDPLIVPLDFDGDGFTPCTGDCDESDPLRNAGAEPICGNGIEDNCDGVSDCTYVGVGLVTDAPLAIEGLGSGVTAYEFGHTMALPGDVVGDEAPDIVVGGFVDALAKGEVSREQARVWWFEGPLDAPGTVDDAVATLQASGDDLRIFDLSDVDGDGRSDLAVAYDETGSSAAHVGLFTAPPADGDTFESAAFMTLSGLTNERMGDSVVSLDEGARIGISARWAQSNRGVVQLLAPIPGARIGFGEAGALLRGESYAYAGSSLTVVDIDSDGVDDLLLGESNSDRRPDVFARVIDSPPESGTHEISDLSVANIRLTAWGSVLSAGASGDLDGDGAEDLVIGARNFGTRVGAVAIFTEQPTGDVDPEEAQIQRFGVGDDYFGDSLDVGDFDGDGAVDLVVGAPAELARGGGSTKPGAVLVWYGPLVPGSEVTLEADYNVAGVAVAKDVRSRAGAEVHFGDVTGDGHNDLVATSPTQGNGVLYAWPGGATADFGL
ncbi:MAG: FG-GAP repeat protein [Myxococcales bacterium]|nr:FG-GAP repeat protein [Myxococcales bacterium]